MIKVLFAAQREKYSKYKPALHAAFNELGLRIDLSLDHPANEVDFIVYAPNGPLKDFTPYIKCKAVLNLWAGVETIVTNKTLTQPLTRMIDTGLTEGMIEWVVGHTLRYHLDIDRNLGMQNGVWDPFVPPLARDRNVTVLGIGELGAACASALAALNFNVTGWSRSEKLIPNITCLSGDEGLRQALSKAEITILLLPLTASTENLLNSETMAYLPKGAKIINPGRGALIDDTDLLDALNSGHVAHATLDVFRAEPLPKEHQFWAHPNVTVTPHIASETRAKTAAQVIAQNIQRSINGEPLLFLVDLWIFCAITCAAVLARVSDAM